MVLSDIARRNSKFYGDKTAIVDGTTRYTFSQFNHRVNSLVNALSALGVRKGDKVMMLTENCHQGVEVAFAGIKGGMVISPINPHLPHRDLCYLINNAEANTIILAEDSKDTVDSIRGELKGVRNLIILGTPQGEMKGYDELLSSYPADEPQVELSEEDLLFLFYSGGTTGLPKQIMHTRKSVLQSTLNFVLDLHSGHNDVHLGAIPYYWGQTIVLMACAPHYTGSTVVITQDTSPKSILELIHKERVTFLSGALVTSLLDYPDIVKYDLSSLRHVGVGGTFLTVETLKRATKVFGNVFRQIYGLSEQTLLTLLTAEDVPLEGPPEKVRRIRSCGKPGFNILLRIVDDEGKDVSPGEVGEIITAGYGIMKGYWKAPEATREALKGGYLWTGDLATMDEEGYVYLVGRKKDVIVSGGKIISPTEVEDILCWHSSVEEAAVIGVLDRELGEVVKAIVVLKRGQKATAEELMELCRQNLLPHAMPRSVEFVDRLPRNSFGKVLKTVLRERYQGK